MARTRLYTLMYHEVTDDPGRSGLQRPYAYSYTLSRRGFIEHLDAIAASPLTPELACRAMGRVGPRLVITFDDGGASNLYAAERLSERGLVGHFFVVTSRLGARRFLDVKTLREIRAMGHVIGSHSHTHPDIFRDIGRERMDAEWRTSRDVLEAALGEACVTASVPGGDISRRVLESAASAGFRCVFTSEPWWTPRRIGRCWVVGRYAVRGCHTAADVRRILCGRGWRRAWLVRRLKGAARRAAPWLYRQYVRQITRPAPDAAPSVGR